MVKIDDFVKANLAFFHHPRRIPNPYYRCKNARRKIKYPVPVKTSRKNSSIIADYHDIGGFIPDGNQSLIDVGMIPLLQCRLVGKFYDDRVLVRVLAGQNGCTLSPEHDLGFERD